MAQTMLLYLITATKQLVRVDVDKLSQAQSLVATLKLNMVSGVRVSRYNEHEGCEVISHRLQGDKLVELPNEFALLEADPDCLHDEQPAPGGGVKCHKCCGWFCY